MGGGRQVGLQGVVTNRCTRGKRSKIRPKGNGKTKADRLQLITAVTPVPPRAVPPHANRSAPPPTHYRVPALKYEL